MGCNCAGRAKKLLGWLGYCQHEQFVAFNGRFGTVVYGNEILQQRHFVITLSAIISRVALGLQKRPCAVAAQPQEPTTVR